MFIRPNYMVEPPAWFYPRILVGAGDMLTPSFVRKYGITHVINCAYGEHSPDWFKNLYPYRYTCLNAEDSLTSNILEWYPKFEQTLNTFLREPGSNTVFIHCQCGINRSAFLTLTYVTSHYRLPYESMFMTMKKQRPCMFTNPVFRKQTEEFVNGRIQDSQDKGDRR